MSRYVTQEQLIIEAIREWSGSNLIGDDCAVLPPGQLITADTLVEGTHFLRSLMRLEDIGFKAAAVNLSDIAAMAGRPRYLFVALTAPDGFKIDEFRAFYNGVLECAASCRATLAGGDVTRGPCLSVTITATGDVHERGVMLRTGARAGDVVVVTGDFGASAAGFWALKTAGDARSRYGYCVSRHLRPIPRLSEAWAMVERTNGQGSMMDASDGLADSLSQIALKSGVSVQIELDDVPVNDETRRASEEAGEDLWSWVLYGGEDFELVGTMPEKTWRQWQEGKEASPFKRIGTVGKGRGVRLTLGGREGPEIDMSRSFQHVG